MSTVVALSKSSKVLYPDPPLGDEEIEVLKALDHQVETPLQRAAGERAISGMKVALSISEPDAPGRVGMFQEHVDAAMLEISRHLLVRGASLAYGGHLGNAGYTTALFDLVRSHQQMSGLPPVERIINYAGWPLPLPREQRAKLRDQATFVRMDVPPGVAALEPQTFVPEPAYFPADSPVRRYAWARGMTMMHVAMFEAVNAITGDYEPYLGTVAAPPWALRCSPCCTRPSSASAGRTGTLTTTLRAQRTVMPRASRTQWVSSSATDRSRRDGSDGRLTGRVATGPMGD